MSTEPVTPDLQADDGMMAGMLLDPPAERQFAWGERPAEIRRLSLKYPELSQSQIAAMVGCSQQRVSEVLVEFLVDTSPEKLDEYRVNKPSIFESVQYKLLSSITQEKMNNQSALQLITGAAILQDKISLMRGQPTSIHVHALVDVLEALRVREEL